MFSGRCISCVLASTTGSEPETEQGAGYRRDAMRCIEWYKCAPLSLPVALRCCPGAPPPHPLPPEKKKIKTEQPNHVETTTKPKPSLHLHSQSFHRCPFSPILPIDPTRHDWIFIFTPRRAHCPCHAQSTARRYPIPTPVGNLLRIGASNRSGRLTNSPPTNPPSASGPARSHSSRPDLTRPTHPASLRRHRPRPTRRHVPRRPRSPRTLPADAQALAIGPPPDRPARRGGGVHGGSGGCHGGDVCPGVSGVRLATRCVGLVFADA